MMGPVDDLAQGMARDLLALSAAFDRATAPPDQFPASVFPSAIADYITEAADTYNLPLSFLGSAVVGVAAAIAGNRCELAVKALQTERLIFWLPLVGDPGSGKSGAIDLVRRPIDEIQRRYALAYSDELAQWDALPKAEQRTTSRPTMRAIFTVNATMEAVAQMAAHAPGLVVISDELASWVQMMSRYQSGGSVRSDWLTTWSGAPLKSDRKMAGSVFVSRHCINVMGGMQPDLLPTLRNENGLDDGSLDRMLPAWPPPRRKQWVEADIDPNVAARYADRMLALEDVGTSDEPLTVTFGPSARRVFIEWFNENAATNTDGFSMKGDRHVARLALVLHVLQRGRDANHPLSEATASDAITLFEFYRGEHNRMLAAIGAGLGGRPTDAAARLKSRVLGYLAEAGPEGLARTVLHARLRGNVRAEDLTFVLRELEGEGLTTVEVEATGHRPRETWTIDQRRYEETKQSTSTPGRIFVSSYLRGTPDREQEGRAPPVEGG